MTFARVVLKLAVPTALTYYTVERGLWSHAVGSREAEMRLTAQRQAITKYTKKLETFTKPYLPRFELNAPNFKSVWNCSVKIAFRSLTSFRIDSLIKPLLESGKRS